MKKYMALMACCGLFSCSSIGYISMDSLYPSELSFPSDIRSVGIVDNTVNHDTLLTKAITLGVIEGDGKMMAGQLANYIAEGDYFDEVILCDESLRAGDSINKEMKLSQQEVTELATDLGVDMLITIDGLCIKTWLDKQVVLDVPQPIEVLGGEVSAVTSIYVPTRKEPMHLGLGAQDTLYWGLGDVRLNERAIVDDASTYAASLPVKYFIPRWKAERRFYYAGGSVDMRDASVFVQENNWPEAFNLWQRVYNGSSLQSKKRMHAALNIALYYEMQSNLPEAMKFAKEALDLAKPGSKDFLLITFYYSGQLEPKSIKMQQLDLQMERFKEK